VPVETRNWYAGDDLVSAQMDGDLAVLADEGDLPLRGTVRTERNAGVPADLVLVVGHRNLSDHWITPCIRVTNCLYYT